MTTPTDKPADARIERGKPMPVSEEEINVSLADYNQVLARAESAEADAAALREALQRIKKRHCECWEGVATVKTCGWCRINEYVVSALSTPSPGARILEKLRIAEEALELIALMDSPMGFAGCPRVATKALAAMRKL